MQKTYENPVYPYLQSVEQATATPQLHPVVIVGAGPVGLTAALDLAARGIAVVVIDDNNTVSVGSRAVCYAKRSLEIWDRLGCGDRMMDQGIKWNVGRVFFGDRQVWQFDLLPETGHKCPAFINLQQYYLEQYLVDQCAKSPLITLRWKHKLTGLTQVGDHARLTVETPDGHFIMQSEWVIACDGANSATRRMLGADFKGQFFQDRFLIADIVMKANFPTERWFWFDPPFHRNQSALLHKQCDDVWRLDFQLGWDADPEVEKRPENIIPRVKAMLGDEVEFELEWASVYQFACRRIDQLRHGRVLFAGDSAHQVSPFGARGANSGVQDVDNLCWKLAAVLHGDAPEALMDSYHTERAFAADENIMNSTRSTDFITPKNAASRRFRDAVLDLSENHAFARPLVNSGRLSQATSYTHSPLNTADMAEFSGKMAPGTVCSDAPITLADGSGWFLHQIGHGFSVLVFGDAPTAPIRVGNVQANILRVGPDFGDTEQHLTTRFDGQPGTTYLIRPDQYVVARWRYFDADAIRAALSQSLSEV